MYSDVPQTHWAYDEIRMATYLGLMRGDPTGRFRPNDPATRAEIAAVAVRTLTRSVAISAGILGASLVAMYLLSRR